MKDIVYHIVGSMIVLILLSTLNYAANAILFTLHAPQQLNLLSYITPWALTAMEMLDVSLIAAPITYFLIKFVPWLISRLGNDWDVNF